MPFLCLLLLGFILFSPAVAETEDEMVFYSRLAAGVVKVEAQNVNGRVSIGSGVMIAEGVVATNCHVTRNARSVEVIKGGLRETAEAQISDLEHDICVLNISSFNAPAIKPGRSKPKLGQTVVALGFVGGLGPRLSSGTITSLYEYDGGRVIESSAAFTSGASGGGLFDTQGNLLGLVTFLRHGKEEGHHFSVPADWIYRLIAEKEPQPIAPLGDGAPFWQRTAANQPYFLRAATLQAEGLSMELRSVTEAWTLADRTNADAWFMLGNAHHDLGEPQRAIEAYRSAIANDLDHGAAWYGLGVAYSRSGNAKETESVVRVLKSLDENLADRLSKQKPAK
jgi:serine protease Do